MSKSAQLRTSDVRSVYRLAGECRERGDDHPAWRLHFLAGLAALVSADVAVGTEVSGVTTGRPREIEGSPADWGFENGFDKRGWLNALELLQSDPAYTCTLHHYFRSGGQARGLPLRRSDLLATPDWERSQEREAVYRVGGIDHNMCCFRPIPGAPDAALGAVLCRGAGRRDFSGREAAVVEEAFATLVPLIGGPLARVAEPSPSELPPRQREVLRCLLEGDGDKQAAVRLGISRFTVNVHTKAIYRHFGVQSRAELLARWLRRGWGAKCAWADGGE